MIIYIYLQLMVLYMTFRVKYCSVDNMNLLYRIHVFNFLYSLFTIATGYVEVARGLVAGNGLLKSSTGLFICEIISLILAHIVICVYLCCPNVSLNERILVS